MLIESLARLSIVNEECKERGIVIGSQEFMDETESIIKDQIEVMKKDMQFQMENPGPYAFGLNSRSIVVFPPTYTETGDWAMIIFDEDTQTKEEVYVFQTLYGFIENLAKAFKHIENASSSEQDRKSETETGSIQADTVTDINA